MLRAAISKRFAVPSNVFRPLDELSFVAARGIRFGQSTGDLRSDFRTIAILNSRYAELGFAQHGSS